MPAEGFREDWTGSVETLSTSFTANQRPILQALEVAAVLVMCIAGANIANLLLAAAASRRKDIAVRTALGATRRHLMADLGRETFILSGAGAVFCARTGLSACSMVRSVIRTSIVLNRSVSIGG